jgi:hypothetical protein
MMAPLGKKSGNRGKSPTTTQKSVFLEELNKERPQQKKEK